MSGSEEQAGLDDRATAKMPKVVPVQEVQLRNISFSCLFLLGFVSHAALAASGTELAHGTLYPRVLRVEHGPVGSSGHILASTTGHIFESDDEGRSFHTVADMQFRVGSTERCCATLYEVPRQVGALPAGALLYSASFFQDGVPAIEVYASLDEGKSWRYHSTIVRRGDGKHGLWEPQFYVAGDGALAVVWSDETDPCCNQKLAQMRSYDGVTWKDETNTVATAVESDRPGMAVVTPLPAHGFFMTYEVCGHFHCAVFARNSEDGWHWGEPRDPGRLLRTADGGYFEHAPTNVWIPSAPGGGVVLVAGQVTMKSDGSLDPLKNGRILLASSHPESWDAWRTVQAPVDVPRSFDNYCPNYSSALLPVNGGQALLELASDYDAAGACRTYFATEPLAVVLAKQTGTRP